MLKANLLLKEYLLDKSQINFEMKGSYNNEKEEGRFIYEIGIKDVKNNYFQHEHFPPCKGKSDKRLSLSIGLHKFNEGITLSYAEKIDNSKNYSPFVPFAYLSNPYKKRTFILNYDPKGETGEGPIVVHGGFPKVFIILKKMGLEDLLFQLLAGLSEKK